jgi:hypothetical protein
LFALIAANQYNEQIRTKILDKESELSSGDFLMVVKNNYFWLKDLTGFIANGDIIEVLEISISRNCTDLSLLM